MTKARELERFGYDPVAAISGQFALCRPWDERPPTFPASPVGVRPWGLRSMRPVGTGGSDAPDSVYCHVRQVAVDRYGTPLIDGAAAGPPTASTTGNVDGEDPPSSEDWANDFVPDRPAEP